MDYKTKEPIYDEPISPEVAKKYVENYQNNKHFKPSDFRAFYFHRDEIQIVLDQNKDKEYIKFTLGMKELKSHGNTLYGCVMMTSSDVVISEIDLAADDDDIYDFSRPVPPHPENE